MSIHTRLGGRRAAFAVMAILAAQALPAAVDGQVRRGRAQPETPPWAPITVAVHGGWEQEQFRSGGVIGAQIRIPVIRSGRLEVVPSIDAVYPSNLDAEYQFNADVVYLPAGRRGGVFAGGGIAVRESILASFSNPANVERGRYHGFNIVLGGRNQLGPVALLLSVRWTLIENSAFDPNSIFIGVGLPLW